MTNLVQPSSASSANSTKRALDEMDQRTVENTTDIDRTSTSKSAQSNVPSTSSSPQSEMDMLTALDRNSVANQSASQSGLVPSSADANVSNDTSVPHSANVDGAAPVEMSNSVMPLDGPPWEEDQIIEMGSQNLYLVKEKSFDPSTGAVRYDLQRVNIKDNGEPEPWKHDITMHKDMYGGYLKKDQSYTFEIKGTILHDESTGKIAGGFFFDRQGLAIGGSKTNFMNSTKAEPSLGIALPEELMDIHDGQGFVEDLQELLDFNPADIPWRGELDPDTTPAENGEGAGADAGDTEGAESNLDESGYDVGSDAGELGDSNTNGTAGNGTGGGGSGGVGSSSDTNLGQDGLSDSPWGDPLANDQWPDPAGESNQTDSDDQQDSWETDPLPTLDPTPIPIPDLPPPFPVISGGGGGLSGGGGDGGGIDWDDWHEGDV